MFNLAKNVIGLASQSTHRLIVQQQIKASFNIAKLCLSTESVKNINELISSYVKKKQVVVFMKGTPAAPRCGFSRAVAEILKVHGVEYESYNVLENEELRGGIKEFSNWPTIPQVFINGEFIGGCDIMLEMHKTGELIDELKSVGIKSKLDEEETPAEKK